MKTDEEILSQYIKNEYSNVELTLPRDAEIIKNSLGFQKYLCYTRINILYDSVFNIFKGKK